VIGVTTLNQVTTLNHSLYADARSRLLSTASMGNIRQSR
jgi:hypothetical protein